MGTPQIILIVLFALGGGVTMAKHGQSRADYNFGTWFVAMAIEVGLLYWGGFFG